MIDAKPAPRVRDPELLRRLHLRWRDCALCGTPIGRTRRLSLHHIYRHPRDDVEGNLVMLCGDGVTGCHGDVEARREEALADLRRVIEEERHDVIEYLDGKLGGLDQALAWLDRYVTA